MRKSLLFLSFLASAGLAGAQVVEGFYATDFTVTPLNNGQVPFNLYTELNAGKPVILDVSATWCQPCWNYHNNGPLKNLYNQYGPNGTDELRVIFYEGDAQTQDACFNGPQGPCSNGTSTQGDWLAGTPYPMANPSSPSAVNNPYGVGAFPTLFLICPNRKVEKFSQSLSAAQIYQKAMACPVATQSIDVTNFAYKGDKVTCGDLDTKVTIQNLGTTNLTSATVTVKKGATVLGTQNWTGNLATYAVTDVNFGTLNFGNTSGTLTIETTTTGDTAPANNTFNQAIASAEDQNDDKFTINVKLDAYANEVFVRLYTSSGSTVWQKQYTSADNNKTYSYPVDLDVDQCYYFRVTDSYGDGLLSGGYVRLTNPAGTHIFTANGSFSEKNFGLTPRAESGNVSIEESAENDALFMVYPNPANDVLNTSVTLTAAEKVNFRVVNAQGQVVMNQLVALNEGTSTHSFDISSFAAGIYTMQITANGVVTSKVFIKQ